MDRAASARAPLHKLRALEEASTVAIAAHEAARLAAARARDALLQRGRVHHLDSCQVRHRTSTYDVVHTSYDIVCQTYNVVFNIARTISYVRY